MVIDPFVPFLVVWCVDGSPVPLGGVRLQRGFVGSSETKERKCSVVYLIALPHPSPFRPQGSHNLIPCTMQGSEEEVVVTTTEEPTKKKKKKRSAEEAALGNGDAAPMEIGTPSETCKGFVLKVQALNDVLSRPPDEEGVSKATQVYSNRSWDTC